MENKLVKPERLEIEKVALQAKEAFLAVADEKVWLREIGFAMQILRNNAAAFSKCDPVSIQDAVTNVALTGATLSPAMQQAFLIPRSIKGVMKCCLDYSYRGLVKIAVDNSDSIYDIDAVCVYANDDFYFEQGINPVLKHIPCLKDRGEIEAVYAIATLHHSIKKFIVLSKDDVDKARKASQAPNSPMWTQWYEEAARKTAVKRLYKLLPQSERMAIAVNTVNEHEGLDLAPSKAAEVQARFVEPLTTSIDGSYKKAVPVVPMPPKPQTAPVTKKYIEEVHNELVAGFVPESKLVLAQVVVGNPAVADKTIEDGIYKQDISAKHMEGDTVSIPPIEDDVPEGKLGIPPKPEKGQFVVDGPVNIIFPKNDDVPFFERDKQLLIDIANNIMNAQPPLEESAIEDDGPQDSSVVEGLVEDIKKKEGVKGNKPWIKFTIILGGEKYNTFSKTIAEEAKKAKVDGKKISIFYTTNNFGNDIHKINVVGVE